MEPEELAEVLEAGARAAAYPGHQNAITAALAAMAAKAREIAARPVKA
jgi:hypothetical protein